MSYNINNSNLLYYYPFDVDFLDYASGTGVSDLTYSNVSISTGATKLKSGSLLTPGTTNEQIKVPNFAFTTNGVTFATWMKCNSVPPKPTNRIFDFGSGASSNVTAFWFSDGAGTLGIAIYNPSIGATGNYSTGYVLSDTNWHHYVMSFTTAGNCYVYVDGVLTSGALTLYPSLATLTNSLIGISNWSGDVSNFQNIQANFNQFLVFNRTLTTTEIGYLVNNPAQVVFTSVASGIISTYPCFRQGTQILRLNLETNDAEYVPVETLRKGDLIKTFSSGYLPVRVIGRSILSNPTGDPKVDNRLYKFVPEKIEELTDPLFITGNHCILYSRMPEPLKDPVEKHMGKIMTSEGQYRVPAFLDPRATPYDESGPATIWHFALENKSIYENYGVYANGLLVESSSIRYMTELSNMELLE